MAKKPNKTETSKGPATINNRRATYDYHILDRMEAGLVLVGSEVKSLYLGRANLTDAYVQVIEDEAWILELDIEPYKFTGAWAPERRRKRKLLLHRKEINLLERKSQEKGLALLALSVYFKNGKAKVQIGLARGKKEYDKRTAIAERETKMEQARARSRDYD